DCLSKILAHMSHQDRKSIAAVDDRLKAIEAKAGCRRLKKIECTSNIWRPNVVKMCADQSDIVVVDANSVERVTYFTNATVDLLSIKGQYQMESEKKRKKKSLLAAIRTAKCPKLLFELSDDSSSRFLKDVVRMHNELHEVSICVVKPQMEIDATRNALLELPLCKFIPYLCRCFPIAQVSIPSHPH
ncbi:hypothetical protein PRIPAC_88193, partial [Pristionchus pacificus]